MSKSKPFFAALLAASSTLVVGAAPAQAHPVQWSVTVGTPAVVLQPSVALHHVPVVVWPAYRRVAYQAPTRWDHDGDRIPNWHDRLYNPRWDVDGDGVPNRRDRHDDRYRRGR